MLRASAAAEAAGIPTASLVCDGFLGQGRSTAAGIGMPNIPLAQVTGHVDVQTTDELVSNIVGVTVPAVIKALTEDPPPVASPTEPKPTDVVFQGTFEEVNQYFYENGWTDGLPIVPPTLERVQAFLKFTDLPQDTVLGQAQPDNRIATVWNAAVNGVMAGCKPEYMPVMVAAIQAMCDEEYGVEHSGNTPGAETLLILNGPIAQELGFNAEQGVLRDGIMANTALGRWWRLCLKNIAGFRHQQTDKATFGGTWKVAMAENEDVLQEIGWPPMAAEFGYKLGENAISIARFTGGDVVTSVFGDKAESILPYLADALARISAWQLVFTVGMSTGTYRPLLIISPILARTIAKSGWSKDQVKDYLFENARIPAHKFEKYMGEYTNLIPGRRTLYDMAQKGEAPPVFGVSDDPERLVPIVCEAKDFLIAVSGDPGRTNAYVMSHNGQLGYTVGAGIRTPQNWPALLDDLD